MISAFHAWLARDRRSELSPGYTSRFFTIYIPRTNKKRRKRYRYASAPSSLTVPPNSGQISSIPTYAKITITVQGDLRGLEAAIVLHYLPCHFLLGSRIMLQVRATKYS